MNVHELIDSIKPIRYNNVNWRISISGTFKNNYDIIHVDELVKNQLRNEKTYLVIELKSKFLMLEMKMKNKSNDMVTINNIRSELNKTVDMIREILNDVRIENYVNATLPYLYRYKELRDSIDPYDVQERIRIIEVYLDLSKKYCNIDISRIKTNTDDLCYGCGAMLDDEEPNENGVITCPNCGVQLDNVNLYKKELIMNSGKRSSLNDDSIDNFKKSVDFYQGKNIKIKDIDNVIFELDNYFNRFPGLDRVTLWNRPYDSYGLKEGTSHDLLLNALEKIRKTKYYKYVWYIGHVYWGWLLRDITSLEDEIYRIYNLTQIQYNKIPIEERERSSSLGTNFRLFKILEMLGTRCHIREFKIAENEKSWILHNELWEIMCRGCNDPKIFYIDTRKSTHVGSFVSPYV